MDENNLTVPATDKPARKFEGYTLDEIRYQRALVLLRKDFCQSKIRKNVANLQKFNPLSPSADTRLSGIAGKILSGVGYLDYIMIGLSVFGSVRKLFSVFKKKK